MKSIFIMLKIALISGIIVAAYIYAIKPFERVGLEVYYQRVTKNLVQDKIALTQESEFFLGLYRPELPYEFGMLFVVQEGLSAQVSIVSYYQAWGDQKEHAFLTDVNRNLVNGGYTPLITWEPWVSAFKKFRDSQVDSSLNIISQGQFDLFIHAWAREAAKLKKPFFLRPGHEMSNPWYSWSTSHGNSPESYKRFWRHVHDIFAQEGARNVAFVWNPYIPADTANYPGDKYVDWIGLDIFNFGSLAENGLWMDFYTVTKILYDAVKGYNKPIIIAEAGCGQGGGNKNDWYRDMFHSLATKNFPLVKGLIIFDAPQAQTPSGLPVDLSFTSDAEVYTKIDKKEITDHIKIKTYHKGENL